MKAYRNPAKPRGPNQLAPMERHQTQIALASLERAEIRTVKGTDITGMRARLEDQLWELSRIADALEERLRTMEERTRL